MQRGKALPSWGYSSSFNTTSDEDHHTSTATPYTPYLREQTSDVVLELTVAERLRLKRAGQIEVPAAASSSAAAIVGSSAIGSTLPHRVQGAGSSLPPLSKRLSSSGSQSQAGRSQRSDETADGVLQSSLFGGGAAVAPPVLQPPASDPAQTSGSASSVSSPPTPQVVFCDTDTTDTAIQKVSQVISDRLQSLSTVLVDEDFYAPTEGKTSLEAQRRLIGPPIATILLHALRVVDLVQKRTSDPSGGGGAVAPLAAAATATATIVGKGQPPHLPPIPPSPESSHQQSTTQSSSASQPRRSFGGARSSLLLGGSMHMQGSGHRLTPSGSASVTLQSGCLQSPRRPPSPSYAASYVSSNIVADKFVSSVYSSVAPWSPTGGDLLALSHNSSYNASHHSPTSTGASVADLMRARFQMLRQQRQEGDAKGSELPPRSVSLQPSVSPAPNNPAPSVEPTTSTHLQPGTPLGVPAAEEGEPLCNGNALIELDMTGNDVNVSLEARPPTTDDSGSIQSLLGDSTLQIAKQFLEHSLRDNTQNNASGGGGDNSVETKQSGSGGAQKCSTETRQSDVFSNSRVAQSSTTISSEPHELQLLGSGLAPPLRPTVLTDKGTDSRAKGTGGAAPTTTTTSTTTTTPSATKSIAERLRQKYRSSVAAATTAGAGTINLSTASVAAPHPRSPIYQDVSLQPHNTSYPSNTTGSQASLLQAAQSATSGNNSSQSKRSETSYPSLPLASYNTVPSSNTSSPRAAGGGRPVAGRFHPSHPQGSGSERNLDSTTASLYHCGPFEQVTSVASEGTSQSRRNSLLREASNDGDGTAGFSKSASPTHAQHKVSSYQCPPSVSDPSSNKRQSTDSSVPDHSYSENLSRGTAVPRYPSFRASDLPKGKPATPPLAPPVIVAGLHDGQPGTVASDANTEAGKHTTPPFAVLGSATDTSDPPLSGDDVRSPLSSAGPEAGSDPSLNALAHLWQRMRAPTPGSRSHSTSVSPSRTASPRHQALRRSVRENSGVGTPTERSPRSGRPTSPATGTLPPPPIDLVQLRRLRKIISSLDVEAYRNSPDGAADVKDLRMRFCVPGDQVCVRTRGSASVAAGQMSRTSSRAVRGRRSSAVSILGPDIERTDHSASPLPPPRQQGDEPRSGTASPVAFHQRAGKRPFRGSMGCSPPEECSGGADSLVVRALSSSTTSTWIGRQHSNATPPLQGQGYRARYQWDLLNLVPNGAQIPVDINNIADFKRLMLDRLQTLEAIGRQQEEERERAAMDSLASTDAELGSRPRVGSGNSIRSDDRRALSPFAVSFHDARSPDSTSPNVRSFLKPPLSGVTNIDTRRPSR